MSQKKLPILAFAHANGFPLASYELLLDLLRKDFEVIGLDKFGHNAKYPVNNNWEKLTDEYLEFLQDYENVIGVGHSFGGLLTYLAALKDPKKFSAAIMMEPPLMVGNFATRVLKLAKKLGFMDSISPSKFAKKRRTEFESKAQALEYFSKKGFFAKFNKQCLEDYVNCGLVEADGKAHLAFDAKIEAEIFRKMPDNLGNAHKKLQTPMALIYATGSDLLTKNRLQDLRDRDYFLIPTKGGHMFPLEYPEDTHNLINSTLSKLLVGAATNRTL